MTWFYKFNVANLIVGSYIIGYETSNKRDKSRDNILYMKYLVMAPIFVPIYIYKNRGLNNHNFKFNFKK